MKHKLLCLSPENQYRLKQLGIIVLYWVIMLRIMVIQNFLGVSFIPAEFCNSKFIHILHSNLWASTCAGIAIALTTGTAELFLFPLYAKHKPLLRIIFGKIIIYLVSITLISILTAFFYNKTKGLSNAEAISRVSELLTTGAFLYIFSITFFLSFGLNFYLVVQNKIGVNDFFKIIWGKYYHPREENRIFLFLDLKSSSLMAEQLGHREYSTMLQSCYRELSELVLRYNGCIYQFVGDEAVITWYANKPENFHNSIELFFAFTKQLHSHADFYRKQFGVVPEFKGAINAGKVMTAEIGGVLKTEIAYHGDVLNTASRMLELAKMHPGCLITSSEVIRQAQVPTSYQMKELGNIALRGKNNPQQLFLICSEKNQNTTLQFKVNEKQRQFILRSNQLN